MRQAPIEPTDDVLDIAGGTGDVTFTVARAKHPHHIQCTDLVNEMLDVARAHYADGAACGVPVDFEVVDAQTRATTPSPWHTASATCPTARARSPRCSAC